MSDGSVTIGGGSSALFPSQSTSAGGDLYGYDSHATSGESHYSGEDAGADGDHAGEHAHHITDFGIGTLVLAMCLGAASRTYLTHVTG